MQILVADDIQFKGVINTYLSLNFNNKSQMNLASTQFDSPKKETRRSSILKLRTDNKECSKKEPKGLSTTIRHSVKFKEEQPQQQTNVRQFDSFNTKVQKQKQGKDTFQNQNLKRERSYSKWTFFKGVNNINYLYSNVLIMATQNCKQVSEKAEQKQLIQLNKAIQQLVDENKKLKQQIEEKHNRQNDLHELGEYLHCSIDDLINKNKLQSFISDYLLKQEECDELQKRCSNIDEFPYKKIDLTQAYIKQKQKKCQALRKKIERQKNAIKKLQKQEAQLLKNLYKSQKEITKNERLSSALKLKINQIQIDNQYRLAKAKAKSNYKLTQNKENIQPAEETKYSKINNKQSLKSKVSLAKLLKKQ